MSSNTIKEQAKETKQKKGFNLKLKGGKRIQQYFDGTILLRSGSVSRFPFIIFISFLTIVYIGNTYRSEEMIIQIQKITSELQELRSIHITTRYELMKKKHQTQIVNLVTEKNLEIKESKTPPFIIKVTEEELKTLRKEYKSN